AAQLLETLARAMHYAHQCGILHRGLKPTKVLLTTEGQPKITGFGLSRPSNADPTTTLTGGIFPGTPNYMAPEQIRGAADAIGPWTDGYARGAILYEVLTGQPPYAAETPAETLRQVAERKLMPPRRLRPDCPADLEAICLKCLHKDWRLSYAGA